MTFELNQVVRLRQPYIWNLSGADDVDYKVFAVQDGCGSGTCVKVTPAVQPGHPHKEDVWYDAVHFLDKTTTESNSHELVKNSYTYIPTGIPTTGLQSNNS